MSCFKFFFSIFLNKQKIKGRKVRLAFLHQCEINNFLVALLVIGKCNTFVRYYFDIFQSTIKRKS